MTAPIRAALASDRGHVRGENEDACLLHPSGRLFILADGMGGRNAGAIAAQLIISSLPHLVERELLQIEDPESDRAAGVRASVRRAVIALNAQLLRQGSEKPDLHGMGATVVLALLDGVSAHVVHLGDSRAYLARRGELRRLTADHNLSEWLLQLDRITVAEAATHPGRHRLTRYVGMEGDASPDAQTLTLEGGDRLLLCSDGLSGMLTDAHLAEIVVHATSPWEACQALVAAANAAGGRDNVSVIVVEIDAVPVPLPLPALGRAQPALPALGPHYSLG